MLAPATVGTSRACERVALLWCGPRVPVCVCVALHHVQNLIPRWSSKVARARPTLSVGAEVIVESFGYIPYK